MLQRYDDVQNSLNLFTHAFELRIKFICKIKKKNNLPT